jgi:hypothetical protein
MASLMTDIRSGLATRVATVTSLKDRCFSTFPDRMPNPPLAIISVPSWRFDQTFSDDNTITAEVLILAAAIGKGQERAQAALDAYLDDDGTESIKAAIEADVTLGGKAQSVSVTGWDDYGDVEVNGIHYLGAVLAVEVFA